MQLESEYESSDLVDLDALWAETVLKSKPKKVKDPAKQEPSSSVYLNPDNWTRTRGIALIHAPTQTLLGNFSEYVHGKIPNCRKLLREPQPIPVDALETVEGDWWLGIERKPEPVQVWHIRRPAVLHIYLDELKVHAPACHVIAFASYGSIARVELAEDTRFAQWEDGGASGEVLLDLPAGTNIYEVMSRDSKIKLREEIGI